MTERIAIIGLGYVGLPLAVALSRHHDVVGFDISISRIQELKKGFDRTNEVDQATLAKSSFIVTSDITDISNSKIYIITVPTPVDQNNKPDLSILKRATEMVGNVLKSGDIVVYESTVYPGVTEDICGPILETVSSLKSGQDFHLGYSPERINPGDREHTLDKITKVVSAQSAEIADRLRALYGSINNNNIFVAANIKTAEAAKVIENAQRDINIAFMNEISHIFDKLDLSTYEVLEAAKTKWNFLPFTPGLVGGHCIGVDPYYLADCANQHGYQPDVLLSGRRINDKMGQALGEKIHSLLRKPSRILVLGLTFKENVPDLRNTKVVDIIATLKNYGHSITVHDGMADAKEAFELYDIKLETNVESLVYHHSRQNALGESVSATSKSSYDAIIGAVAHDAYKGLSLEDFENLLQPGGLIVDIKNIWTSDLMPQSSRYWKL